MQHSSLSNEIKCVLHTAEPLTAQLLYHNSYLSTNADVFTELSGLLTLCIFIVSTGKKRYTCTGIVCSVSFMANTQYTYTSIHAVNSCNEHTVYLKTTYVEVKNKWEKF
jgi:hypothetical protein